ncbi:MAG TPA: MFS transporter [Kofleriaceae bacterium]|jgi:MFS family permease|nr:MFS transporter [Kofleriaceae bacterium]
MTTSTTTSAATPVATPATFWTIWCGQLVSVLGSGITQFALAVWAFQRSGSATQFGVIAMCAVLPGLLLSPVAGAFVDRWNRRTAMLVADAGAALASGTIAALVAGDRIAVWQLYAATAFSSSLAALHQPAYQAMTSMLVPKHRLGQASGAVLAADAAAELCSPVLGGLLLPAVGLTGIFVIDLCTFAIAVATLSAARVPSLPRRAPSIDSLRSSIWREIAEAWRYVAARPGLVGLLALSCVTSLAVGFLEVLSAPVVLSRASPGVLGAVRSFSGAGMLAGSIAMQLWGGPRARVAGMVGFQLALGAHLVVMGFLTAPWLLAAAGFGALFSIPLVNGCAQTLWQTKVALHLQGRVFALRRLARICRPLGFVAAGALADRVLDPLMSGGGFARAVGPWIGVGPGRGSALLLALVGATTLVATLAVSRYRPLREVQHELPDAH